MKKIIATPNYRNRTFTLRIFNEKGRKSKYRTLPMKKEEFNKELKNTENDWKQFLKTDEYYKI